MSLVLMSIEPAILGEVMIVTIREAAIAKIQQPPDSLVQKIIDFIDAITHHHQTKIAIDSLQGNED